MGLPEQRTRILAGTPIEIGEQRLLPSVLVKTINTDQSGLGKLHIAKLRPISVVVTSPQNTQWLEIQNSTMDTLSTMAGVGAAIALVSLLIIIVARLFRH